jgi:hypothetical protein
MSIARELTGTIAAALMMVACSRPSTSTQARPTTPASAARAHATIDVGAALLDLETSDVCVAFATTPLSSVPLCTEQHRLRDTQEAFARNNDVQLWLRHLEDNRQTIVVFTNDIISREADVDAFARGMTGDQKRDDRRTKRVSTPLGLGWLRLYDSVSPVEHAAVLVVPTSEGTLGLMSWGNPAYAPSMDAEVERLASTVRKGGSGEIARAVTTIREGRVTIDVETPPDTCALYSSQTRAGVAECQDMPEMRAEEHSALVDSGVRLFMVRNGSRPSMVIVAITPQSDGPPDWDALIARRAAIATGRGGQLRRDAKSHALRVAGVDGYLAFLEITVGRATGRVVVLFVPTTDGMLSVSWFDMTRGGQRLDAEAARAIKTLRAER